MNIPVTFLWPQLLWLLLALPLRLALALAVAIWLMEVASLMSKLMCFCKLFRNICSHQCATGTINKSLCIY